MDYSFDVDLYKRDVEIIRSYIISLREERKGRIYLKLDFEKDESFTEMEKKKNNIRLCVWNQAILGKTVASPASLI